MKHRSMRAAVAIGAAFAAASAAPISVSAAPLQAGAPWTVDYGVSQCTAARQFNTAAGPVILGLVPSLNGASYTMKIAVPRAGPLVAQDVAATVDVGGGPIATRALYYGGRGVALSNYEVRLNAQQAAAAASTNRVSFSTPGADHYDFDVSAMPALTNELNNCTAGLQRSWNTGMQRASFRRTVTGDVDYILAPQNLASDSQLHMVRDALQYELLVDERGRVARCDVLRTSGDPAIDTTGCNLLTARARFRPALDNDGRPVRAAFVSAPVTWQDSYGPFDTGCSRLTNGGLVLLSYCNKGAVNLPNPSIGTPSASTPPPPTTTPTK